MKSKQEIILAFKSQRTIMQSFEAQIDHCGGQYRLTGMQIGGGSVINQQKSLYASAIFTLVLKHAL
jgi:hypothetical protein